VRRRRGRRRERCHGEEREQEPFHAETSLVGVTSRSYPARGGASVHSP
jgi:hypothetical protein